MKQVTADVAVVAAGPAGLAAAISAAESGAAVVVFEKSSTTGGAGNMGMGPLGVNSNFQRKRMVFLEKEEAFEKFMTYTHWRVDARLVREYLYKSADTIQWLEDMGVEFWDVKPYFKGSEATWHIVKPESGVPGPRAASVMYKIMTERAKELGVEFYLECPVKKLLKEDGHMAGLIAESSTGEEIRCNAKAVIIATGGFGDNPEMIKAYLGYEWGKDLFSFRIPGLKGDGIKMAWEAGAGRTDIILEMTYQIPSASDKIPSVARVLTQPNLVVNIQGERFINEAIMGNTTFTGNAIARQKGRCAFCIIDSSIKKHYERNGLDFISLVHPTFEVEDFDEQFKEALESGSPDLFYGETLEELADKAGIDKENLLATVEEYNYFCNTGRDELFNKPKQYLRPLKKGPFYAARFFPSAYGTLGGIKINHKTEVMTDDFEIIPGLYAAGTDACSIFGDSYVFIMPGNTMGFCINSGCIAGENAAAYVNSL